MSGFASKSENEKGCGMKTTSGTYLGRTAAIICLAALCVAANAQDDEFEPVDLPVRADPGVEEPP